MKKQVKSLIITAKDVAGEFAKTGDILSHQSEQRMAICMACPEKTPSGVCSKCGCFIKTKVKLKAAKCPIGKWK